MHVQSEKYLTVYPNQLAIEERENLQIKLNSDGSSLSWFQIIPKYKIDRLGDKVMNNHSVYFTVAERASEYIHVADKEPRPGKHREVNCSLEQSSWKVLLYQGIHSITDKSMLLASQLVLLQDPETLSNLCLTIAENTVDDEDSITSSILRAHEIDGIVLAPEPKIIDTNHIWTIERKNNTSGGTLKWKSKKFRCLFFYYFYFILF